MKEKATTKLGVIKICPDPHCDAVYHNCDPKHTKCNDCGGWIIKISEETYWKKYANYFFQYDFRTMEFFRPEPEFKRLEFDF